MLIGDSDFSNLDSIPDEDFISANQVSRGEIIRFGFRSDVYDNLLNVDVLISMSKREGIPFSVLDGIDAGNYLLLSPVPGHLSFSNLDGVSFIDPTELDYFFQRDSRRPGPISNI